MARIVGGSMIGELSGKMGGMVFARNRGGQYIRSYAIPVNPNTLAQQNARDAFGISSNNYHGLTDEQKSQWKNFASVVFNPKTGTQGVPSGLNAFTALNSVVLNNTVWGESIYTPEPLGTALTGTKNVFSSVLNPPSFNLEANFKDSADGINPISFGYIDSVSVDYPLTPTSKVYISASLNINAGGVGPGGNCSRFTDAKDNDFGFVAFMSNPVAQANMFIQNPYMMKIGTWEGLKTVTTPAAFKSSLLLDGNRVFDFRNYHAFPQEGQWVLISIFQVSTTGMLNKIGSDVVQMHS